jgi:hypothetical protein
VKKVYVNKAGKLPGQEIEAVTIVITGSFPYNVSLEKSNAMLNEDADKLFVALRDSLPKGVFDRLTAKMLTSAASTLIVNRAVLISDVSPVKSDGAKY